MTERITDRIEGLFNRIPGYTGYRQKESMRDDDRRLREEISRSLDGAIDDLTSLGSRMAAERRLELISTVEDAITRTRHLESRVRTATYGYGGIFSDRSVDQYALQQLKAFDVAFQTRVDGLVQSISQLADSSSVDAPAFATLTRTITDLNKLFETRGDVIETATPTEDPDVLALLETPRAQGAQETQLLRIRRGGTGAILGDNYQFTAHIALASRSSDPILTLVELDGGPEWLAVTDDGAETRLWRVTETEGAEPGPANQAASATVSGPQGTQSGVPATYAVTASGAGDEATVSIQLAVAGSNRAYAGGAVPLIDVQVFSEGSDS